MTDQPRISIPGGRPRKRGSLLERAADVLGVNDELKPAPVPVELADAPMRRARVTPSPPEFEVLPVDVAVAPPREQPAANQKRVEFRSPIQVVERQRLQEQGLVIPDGPVTALMEEFRIVKRDVLRSIQAGSDTGRSQRVLVSSPLPGEGKTFCATNLALAIAAEKQSEVVLVDADFAKPSILALLGLHGDKGLMDALADPTVSVEDCVIATDVSGFYVLPAGNRTSSDSEFLASRRAEEVFARLTQGASNRVLIFDSPPALAASPAAELAKHVGQVLAVCRADQTGQRALEDALSLLSTCPDIKLLLNSAHFSPSGRRFGAYYGYGGGAE